MRIRGKPSIGPETALDIGRLTDVPRFTAVGRTERVGGRAVGAG